MDTENFDISKLFEKAAKDLQEMDRAQLEEDMTPVAIVMPHRIAVQLKSDLEGLWKLVSTLVLETPMDSVSPERRSEFKELRLKLAFKGLVFTMYGITIQSALNRFNESKRN